MDSLKGTLTPMKVLNGTLNGGIAYGTFNYNELENKPSVNGTELVGNVNIAIPTKTSDLTNDSGFITDADVPTKTSDLTNDSGFITDADIPTKTSELTNDSGFITSADIPTIPTKTSQLNNDSGFLTINTTPVKSVNSLTGDVNLFIPNATSQLTNDTGFLTNNTVPVKSVNNQTGDVELTADNIPYDNENSILDKIEDNTTNITALQGDVSEIETTLSGKYGYIFRGNTTVDLNDIKDNGFYSFYKPTNRPNIVNSWAQIIVIRAANNPNYATQICLSNELTPSMHIRVCAGGVWQSWVQVG